METQPAGCSFKNIMKSNSISVSEKGAEVPAYQHIRLNPKRNRFALVICTKNEGDRILNQLDKILNVKHQFDILISDAPSDDGSTSPSVLKSKGVCGLISLLEKGGLSSSLRAAFFQALSDGYEGCLMMDGNDKDDSRALENFFSKMSAGFDYVQGSRFRRGGVAENTPFSRWALIRFIHAPFFSVICGRLFTDTTNGFRGFSRQFLLDKRVDVFRDVFQQYELPYYLAWAACRYKFKVVEIPVIRSYPKGQPVPTKIVGWPGYWRMLKPMLMLILRKY